MYIKKKKITKVKKKHLNVMEKMLHNSRLSKSQLISLRHSEISWTFLYIENIDYIS